MIRRITTIVPGRVSSAVPAVAADETKPHELVAAGDIDEVIIVRAKVDESLRTQVPENWSDGKALLFSLVGAVIHWVRETESGSQAYAACNGRLTLEELANHVGDYPDDALDELLFGFGIRDLSIEVVFGSPGHTYEAGDSLVNHSDPGYGRPLSPKTTP
jgi:hypothetical protein